MHIPDIKNAYENIQKTCEQKLGQLYPHQVPELIKERYQKELDFLKRSCYLNDFEILRCLNAEAEKCSLFLTVRGTLTASYIVYLLRNSLLNPLPAHYYCPHCGHFEIVPTRLFGIDMPDSKCPVCHTAFTADGFNLPMEIAWGANGAKTMAFDYNIPEEFLPFARRVLQSLYPDNVIAPLGLYNRSPKTETIEMHPFGFLILPSGQKTDDYPELTAYMEDGELCLSGNIRELNKYHLKRVLLIRHKTMEDLVSLQRKTGIYTTEITLQDLRTLNWNDLNNTRALSDVESFLFHNIRPRTFFDMVCLDAAGHNTYHNKEYSIHDGQYHTLPDLFHTEEFQKYPCHTREDFFDELLKLGFEREKAFEITEFIRTGKQNFGLQKYMEEFDSLALPEDFKTVARQYLYLFPRSHSAEYILMYAKLAFYAKKDSRIFSKVVYKRRE